MNSKHISTLFLVLFFSLSSCSDFVEGFEEDPNNSSDAPIEAILNGAFVGLIVSHEGEDARLAGMWSRQFTGSDRQYSAYNVYNINAEDFEWDKYYLVVENAEITIEKAATTANLLASGIAKVLKAHSIGMVSSMWGNIPFEEANEFPAIEDPVFDSQEQVYADVQALLDDAITDLSTQPTNAAIEGVDFFFGGDPQAWAAVAHTLKARFYLHTGQYELAIDAAQKGIQSEADDWLAPHFTGAYNQDLNLYNSFGLSDREGYMTAENAVLPSWLDPSSDVYRGNAKTDETARFNHLFTGVAPLWDLNYATDAMWGPTTSFPLATAIENYLTIAEAEWRANSDVDAALAALNAARSIFATKFPSGRYEAYELADFEAGGMASIIGESAADALLHEIMEERYVSLVGQIEVFNDLRRTDNFLEIPSTTGNAIPERYLIPQVEIDANASTPSPIPGLFEPTPLNK
ncbi:MAG: SusD/RagB family nutrient-binding outer membrane lipoprotein [Bacteroidota bacterium]